MKIEEYIKLRKTQDSIDEFDQKKKIENLHSIIDYVFEYFITYVDINALEKRKVERDEKVIKYQNQLREYSDETQRWLLKIYAEYDIRLNIKIRNALNDNDMFLLYGDEAHFRKATFQCYAKLSKKNNFLENYTEELFDFVIDQHRIWSMNYTENSEKTKILMRFPDSVVKFIENTWKKYHVNLLAWGSKYADLFSNEVSIYRYNSKDKEYDVKKEKNKFNLNIKYSQVSDIPYIKGKKNYLELIVMYFWCTTIVGEEEYLEEYLKKFAEK